MTSPFNDNDRLMPVIEVARMLSCSKATIWNGVREGTFPAPIKMGPRLSRWRLGEIKEMITRAEIEARGDHR
jgi:predicted DNA-binding transcriptional regulator AlpA